LPPMDLRVDGNKIELCRMDFQHDLALIRFRSLKYYTVYCLAEAVVGLPVTAVGYPTLIEIEPIRSARMVTKGHISRTNQDYVWYDGGAVPGFSGGSLLDRKQRVVGIITSTMKVYGRNCETMTRAVAPQPIAKLMEHIPE